jgi:hypothetical protein
LSEPIRVGGLDVGQRADHSVLAVLRRDPNRWAVERIDQLPLGLPFREQLALLQPQLDRFAALAIYTGGTGQALPELLETTAQVVPAVLVSGDSVPRNASGRLSVGKARAVHDLLRMIRQGLLVVDTAAPGRELLRAELARFTYTPGGRFKRMEASRGHDDTVMALALAVQLALV